MRPDPVEVIAKSRGKVIDAICGVEDHGRPLEDIFPANVLGAVADAALSTIESVLKDAGYAVVPVEPTEKMFEVGMNETPGFDPASVRMAAERIYRAMLRASQEG